MRNRGSIMEMVKLGKTGLMVSRLCFGTGGLGKIEENISPERGAELLVYALENGVNFWDTAQSYGSHAHVRLALERVGREKVIVNTKTGAKTLEEGRAAIAQALDELGTNYVDSMMLHGVMNVEEFEERQGCLEALLEAKAAGKVRHVSASTHRSSGAVMEVMAAAGDIEVVLSVLNKTGVGLEGDLETHKGLLRAIHEAGKGVMIMKLMDEGKVPDEQAEEWIGWGFEYPHAHCVNLGLTNEEEIDMAVRLGSPLPVG